MTPAYFPRLARLTVQSFLNEGMALMEEGHLGARIAAQQPLPPVFVLGCWRSGTTWLHRLLALDPSLAAPTGLQVLHPHTFFFLEQALPGRAARVAHRLYRPWALLNWGPDAFQERERTSDHVKVGPELAAEDEFAMLMMGQSDLLSYLVGPQSAPYYRRYLSLRELSPEELGDWERSWTWFLRKLTLRHGPRPLVLKSPNHTARVRFLLKLFPGARFVYLYRHPFEVYRSLERHLRLVEPVSDVLQTRPPRFEQTAMELYETVMSAYLEDRALIPSGQLVEVAYEDLEAQPDRVLSRIYDALSLGRPPAVGAPPDYQKNRYPALDVRMQRHLYRRWRRYFDLYGYSVE